MTEDTRAGTAIRLRLSKRKPRYGPGWRYWVEITGHETGPGRPWPAETVG